jgi:hypothetical protein
MWKKVRYIAILLTLCAFATCPAAKRSCDQQNHSREAGVSLTYLEQRLASMATQGKPWPTVSTPVTPARNACCEQGGKCGVEPVPWQHETWRTLQFAMDESHYFSYEYLALPDGTVTLRAIGDLDCDGTFATYERVVTRKAEGVPPISVEARSSNPGE